MSAGAGEALMGGDFEMGAHVLETVGPLWLIAVAGMFLSAVCESARPQPEPGEEKPQGLALIIAGVASLITPIMLFVHAFWAILALDGMVVTPGLVIDFAIAQRIVVVGLFVALAGVAIVGSIVGWLVRAAAPGIGKALNQAAVPLALATLALTVYVTYDAVGQFWSLAAGPRP